MIVPSLARMILREHLYRPINGKVLCLGRQTIALTYEQLKELFAQEGYTVSEDLLKNHQYDEDKNTRFGKGTNYISDKYFFSLLGINELNVMDVSTYEKADIIHDLNHPIPESLVNTFDFIIDGGTFDHLPDFRTAFINVVKMLKPDGRIFQWNAASNFTGSAYISFGPDLFYDLYVLNHFKDCKVYIAEVDSFGQLELWDIYEFTPGDYHDHFQSNRIQMTLVFAEKSPFSTFHKIPIQAQYRDEYLRKEYIESQNNIEKSTRKFLKNGKTGMKLKGVTTNPASIPSRTLRAIKEKGIGYTIGKIYKRGILREKMGNRFIHLGQI